MLSDELVAAEGYQLGASNEKSPVMQNFVNACSKFGLPLNLGKSVVRSFVGACLGGELDGVSGILRVSQEKSHVFASKTAAILSCKQVNQVACQHWAGVACFSAGFRRPIFSVLQEIFQFIVRFDEREYKEATLPPEVRGETLLGRAFDPIHA